jgi:hypothetical protein
MLSTFIPGLEDLVDDGAAPAPTQPETISTVDAELEKAEDVQAASELGAMDAEGERITNTTNVVSDKIDEMERMVAHIQKYGVDRSFLSLCNHDNILNRSFDLQLPSCESFDVVGNPNSIASQEALEGLKNGISKAVAWLKKMWEKFKAWFLKKWHAMMDFFFGNRRKKKMEAINKAFDDLSKTDAYASFEKSQREKRFAGLSAAEKQKDVSEQEIKSALAEIAKLKDQLTEVLADDLKIDIQTLQKITNKEEMFDEDDPNTHRQRIEQLKNVVSNDKSDELYQKFLEACKTLMSTDNKFFADNKIANLSALKSIITDVNKLDDPNRFAVLKKELESKLDSMSLFIHDTMESTKYSSDIFADADRRILLKYQRSFKMYLDVISKTCGIADKERDEILKSISIKLKKSENFAKEMYDAGGKAATDK